MMIVSDDVTVVVPVGPRIDHLREQLGALARQTRRPGFELILSVNGARSEDVERLVWEAQFPERVRVELIDSSDKRGPSHARNVGWRAAGGSLVLFCDADDVAHDDWVASMVSALGAAPIVGGRLDYESLNPRALADWGLVSAESLASKFGHLPFAGSCNLGARMEVLEETGGFDERLSASEDVDFCWRAQYLGYSIAMAPGAVVSYRRRSDVRSLFEQSRNDARNDPALLARHRAHGATWTAADLRREGAGVGVALIGAVASRRSRLQLATRGGRFSGHLRALRSMLRP